MLHVLASCIPGGALLTDHVAVSSHFVHRVTSDRTKLVEFFILSPVTCCWKFEFYVTKSRHWWWVWWYVGQSFSDLIWLAACWNRKVQFASTPAHPVDKHCGGQTVGVSADRECFDRWNRSAENSRSSRKICSTRSSPVRDEHVTDVTAVTARLVDKVCSACCCVSLGSITRQHFAHRKLTITRVVKRWLWIAFTVLTEVCQTAGAFITRLDRQQFR